MSLEWVFKEIVTYFKFIDFKKDLRIGLSPVGKTYAVCALLQIALTCLYDSNTAKYFGIEPPTFEFYFNGRHNYLLSIQNSLLIIIKTINK